MPDAQTIWNAVLTIAVLVITGALTVLRDSLRELQQEDKKLAEDMAQSTGQLAEKVQSIEVLVAGQYVLKDDLERSINRLFTKLDVMDSKLDTKVNRSDCPVIHPPGYHGGMK